MNSVNSLSTLLKNASLDDHEKILKAANAALKANSKDKSAFHVRIVALLKVDRFEDALRAFDEGGASFKKAMPLEYAYGLYKAEKLAEAQNILQEHGIRSQSLLHMAAQVAYRTENGSEAAEIYRTLRGKEAMNTSEESDMRINQSAVDAQLSFVGQAHLVSKKQPEREDLEQFETAFNAACGYMARGDLKQAAFLLTRARDLCNAAEELSDEEKKAEVAPIEAQVVCVLCRQGKYEEARKISSTMQVTDITDKASQRVAQANQLAATGIHTNPYLAQRAFMFGGGDSVNDHLFSFQKSVLSRNSLATDLQTYKFSRVEKGASESAWAGVFAAAAHVRNQTGETAIKELLPLLERRPHNVGLMMTVIQLYAITNNIQTALSLLETFLIRLERSTAPADQDVRFSPGLVGLIVSLYAGQHRLLSAKKELFKAAQYWRIKLKQPYCPTQLLKAAGAALLESPSGDDEEMAREVFIALDEQAPADEVTFAGLTACTTETPQKSQTQQQTLRPIEQLIGGIDVSLLESEGVAKLHKQSTARIGIKRAAEASDKPQKRKRTRKSRLPKDHDPTKTPDPERWLPLRDRSSWKPKGKKKAKAAQGMSTQGGVSNEEARPSTPQQQQQSKPAAPSKSKKKKGKGGK